MGGVAGGQARALHSSTSWGLSAGAAAALLRGHLPQPLRPAGAGAPPWPCGRGDFAALASCLYFCCCSCPAVRRPADILPCRVSTLGRGFLVAQAEKDISLMADSRKNRSSKRRCPKPCSREMSPLAKEQSTCFSAFLGERDRTRGEAGCRQGRREARARPERRCVRRPPRENQFLRERSAGCSGESRRPAWVPPSLLPSLPHSGVGRCRTAVSVTPVVGTLREGGSSERSRPSPQRGGGASRGWYRGV